MTEPEESSELADGRVARRRRNIETVIDVVLEMFAEESMFPTIEQAATRSGLSLRSVYRYFADPAELLEAAIKRSGQRGAELARLPAIGQGPLERRVEDFVAMRLRLYDGVGPVMRATVANAERLPRIRDELARNRAVLAEQFELQFAPELARFDPAARLAILATGDLLTQIDSLDHLRRHRQLSSTETHDVLVAGLARLLDSR